MKQAGVTYFRAKARASRPSAREASVFPRAAWRPGQSVDNVIEKKKEKKMGVHCGTAEARILCEVCGRWRTNPSCPSCVEDQCDLCERCGLLFPHPPPEHTCEVGNPASSGKHYYLFWRECIIIKMKWLSIFTSLSSEHIFLYRLTLDWGWAERRRRRPTSAGVTRRHPTRRRGKRWEKKKILQIIKQ